jgi:hypothetical protein
MQHRIRTHLRALAATTLVLVSALGAWSTYAHGLDCHDPDGAPVLVVHDASAHAFRSPTPPDPERPVHCVLCHWTRVFGPSVQSVSPAPLVLSRTLAIQARDAVVARLISSVQPPLRAPPSASMLDILT